MQIGVGSSEEIDEPEEAVTEALALARHQYGAGQPQVVIVFASFHFDQQALLRALHAALGDIPMLGCTTDGEITTQSAHPDSLSLMLLGGTDVEAVATLVPHVSQDDVTIRTAEASYTMLKRLEQPPRLMLTFPDCSGSGRFEDHLSGIKQSLGKDFPIFGGAPADRAMLKGVTWQYFNHTLHRDSAPMLLIGGNFHIASGLRSGVLPFGRPATCTRARGNQVYEIDNRPAIEHHRAYLGDEFTEVSTIAQFPYLLHNQIIEGHEHFVTLPIFTWDRSSGTIISVLPIDEGATLRLGRCTREHILEGASSAAREIKEQLGGRTPQVLFFFGCSGRKILLGLDNDREIERVKAVLGQNVPTLGFYCYGEVGPLSSRLPELRESIAHGYTLSLVALA